MACVMATQEMIAATVEESGTAVLQTKSNGGLFVGAAKLMAPKVHSTNTKRLRVTMISRFA